MNDDLHGVRLVQLTENEARSILLWLTGPERSGLEPTEDESALVLKMRTVLASFKAGRALTMEEARILQAEYAKRHGIR